jgi:hypothetical protein
VTRKPYVPTASDAARRARVYLDVPGKFAVTLCRGGLDVAAEVRFGPTADPYFPENEMNERPHYFSLWIDDGGFRCVEGPALQVCWLKSGRPISDAEFHWLLEDRAWARSYSTDSPEANTKRAVDVNLLDIPSF